MINIIKKINLKVVEEVGYTLYEKRNWMIIMMKF